MIQLCRYNATDWDIFDAGGFVQNNGVEVHHRHHPEHLHCRYVRIVLIMLNLVKNILVSYCSYIYPAFSFTINMLIVYNYCSFNFEFEYPGLKRVKTILWLFKPQAISIPNAILLISTIKHKETNTWLINSFSYVFNFNITRKSRKRIRLKDYFKDLN